MATPAIPAFRFGKNAVVKVAAATPADGTKPAAADAFKVLCLTNEVTIGLSNGTITLENFCTGGADVEVPDGTTTGKVELGDATWTEADPALILLEARVQLHRRAVRRLRLVRGHAARRRDDQTRLRHPRLRQGMVDEDAQQRRDHRAARPPGPGRAQQGRAGLNRDLA